ncbi:aminopeptidase P family N-terminal domain-containing protein, partial [Ruegeria sp. NA]
MPDLSEYRQLARDLSVDAVALVPGPNFTRALGKAFMSHERPFVVVVPAEGQAAAIVPNLELASWDLVGFEGAVFDWRDQTGYDDAFTALAAHMPIRSLAVEGQVMRVFVSAAFNRALPDLRIVDGEREISGLRIIKTDEDIAAMQAAIDISERALGRVIADVRVGQTEKQVEQALIQALFAEGAESLAFSP